MLNIAVLLVHSNIAAGAEADTIRPMLDHMMADCSGTLIAYASIPDDRKVIREHLIRFCDAMTPDVLLTMGGTGVRPTDWAPEATRDVIEKEIPGIGEAMRQESLKKVRTAMLSRATAGIRGHTLIVNLPGSPKGARENFGVILPILDHTVEKIRKVRNARNNER
jgi:molybdenum cofactor synthesis domain-containing protein